MRNVLKQFGAKGTGSFNDRFAYSIYKLTFFYTAILAVILIMSSGVIYSAFTQRLNQRYRNVIVVPQERGGVVFGEISPRPSRDEVQADLIYSLALVNGLLLIVAGGLSYWLARTTLKPLRDSYERQQKFLADASHELRTPLSILKLDLENTLTGGVNDAAKKQAGSNLEEVDRMSRIVSDLLALSRMNEGEETAVEFEPVNMQTFIEKIIARMQPVAEQHTVKVRMTPIPKVIIFRTHEELLAQALGNLVKNAIIYNKPNGEVRIEAEQDSKTITIKVIDTGIGISSEDQEKIFDRFFRSDSSRSRQTGGSGLGLAIVQASVDKLRGTLDMASEVGKGTTITVQLPLQ